MTQYSTEDMPTLSIDELVVHSDRVVVARLIEYKEEECVFLIKEITSDQTDLADTILLKTRGLLFDKEVQNSTELILFLKEYDNNRYGIVSSGYRVLSEGTIYIPYQVH